MLSLRDNPLPWRHARRLVRLGPIRIAIVLLAWFSLNYWLRLYFIDQLPFTLAAWGLGGELIYGLANYTARADVVAAFFLVLLLVPRQEWPRLRRQLAVTPLAPRELLLGSATFPILLLMLFATLCSPLFYANLGTERAAVYGLTPPEGVVLGVVLYVLALLEDYVFGTLCVMAFLTTALDENAGPLRRAFFPLLSIACTAAVLTPLSFLVIFLLLDLGMVQVLGTSTLSEAILVEVLPMLALLAFELFVIRWLWKRGLQKLGE